MIVFLAGVHGVGKTFLGEPIAAKLNLNHVTASQLIKAERGRPTWDAEKRVSEIDENQSALIAAVNRLTAKGSDLLLDGHFALFDKSEKIVNLAVDIFQRLSVSGVVILEEPPDVILIRLKERSNITFERSNLRKLQAAEIENGTAICAELSIPLIKLVSPTEADLFEAVKSLISQRRESIRG